MNIVWPTNETCRIIQFIIKTGNSTIAMRLMKSIWNRMYFHKHTKNLIINISVNWCISSFPSHLEIYNLTPQIFVLFYLLSKKDSW